MDQLNTTVEELFDNPQLKIGRSETIQPQELDHLHLFNLGELSRNRLQELGELPNKVGFFSISPYEPHGPHLPLKQDILTSEILMEVVAFLFQRQKVYTFKHDTIPFGAHTLYGKTYGAGYFQTLNAIKNVLKIFNDGGFQHVVISNGHGGPAHNWAIGLASRFARRKWGMQVHSTFDLVFQGAEEGVFLIEGFPENLAMIEAHGGAVESSITKLVHPQLAKNTENLSFPDIDFDNPVAKLLNRLTKIIVPNTPLQRTMHKNLLAWILDTNAPDYLGDPSLASPEAGAEMLEQFADFANERLVIPVSIGLQQES